MVITKFTNFFFKFVNFTFIPLNCIFSFVWIKLVSRIFCWIIHLCFFVYSTIQQNELRKSSSIEVTQPEETTPDIDPFTDRIMLEDNARSTEKDITPTEPKSSTLDSKDDSAQLHLPCMTRHAYCRTGYSKPKVSFLPRAHCVSLSTNLNILFLDNFVYKVYINF